MEERLTSLQRLKRGLARLRGNRFGNAVVGALLMSAVAIGVTQLMMMAGFG